MCGVRRWLHHRWLPFLVAALAGLIISSTVSLAWQRSFSEPAITLLGSGHGLSALMSTGSARMLIVGGDDPIAFANALTHARPPTMRRIDVMILTPSASPHVAERAIELAAPERIMAIDASDPIEESPDDMVIDEPVRRVSAPRTIDLGGELLLDIDPGLIAGKPSIGWRIRAQTGSIAVLLAESVPFRPGTEVGLVAIMGDTVPDTARSLTTPVAMAADVENVASGAYGLVEPGESQRIPIKPTSVIVPLDWVRQDDV